MSCRRLLPTRPIEIFFDGPKSSQNRRLGAIDLFCCRHLLQKSHDSSVVAVIDAPPAGAPGYRDVGSVDEMDDDATDGGCDSGEDDSGCMSLTFTPPNGFLCVGYLSE